MWLQQAVTGSGKVEKKILRLLRTQFRRQFKVKSSRGIKWISLVRSKKFALLLAGAELGGCQGGPLPPPNSAWPPSGPPNFSGLFLKVLHRPLTAPLVAKLAPPMAPPNENAWLRPWLLGHTLFSKSRSLTKRADAETA